MNTPKVIYIIRHCDKTGDDTDDLCSDEGYKRANALAGFTGTCVKTSDNCNNTCSGGTFSGGYFPNLLGDTKPVLIAITSKKDPAHIKGSGCSSSNRFCLMLNPLAARYNISINSNKEIFCVDQNAELAAYILNNPDLYAGKTIIIAAHSKGIPDLVNAFSPDVKLGDWPKKAKERFDLVFKLDFTNNPSTPNLTISTMNLGISDTDSKKIPFKIEETFMLFNKPMNTKYILIGLSIVLLLILVIFLMYKMKSNKY